MNIYLDNGYLDVERIIKIGMPFTFVIGARGIGKTYGMLSYIRKYNKKFMYIRRKQTQIDMITNDEFNPFNPINRDCMCDIYPCPMKNGQYAFYNCEYDNDKFTPVGAPLGFAASLSTFSNMRGFDGSDIDIIFYDEFIPEKGERKIKGEDFVLFNAYETINRNRELSGKPPVLMVCMSNSNDIANPLFISLHLVKKVNDMIVKGQEVSIMKDRGLAIINILASPISSQKSQTALYKLTRDTDFFNMAISNNYNFYESEKKSVPIKELIPLVRVGEIQIDEWKSHDRYYVTTKFHGTPNDIYDNSEIEFSRMSRKYRDIVAFYMENMVVFEEYICEVLFQKYFNIKV